MTPRQAATAFGERLKEARDNSGNMSQAELAQKLGVSRGVIANYERGEGSPDPMRAVQLGRILAASPEEFLLLATLQKGAVQGCVDSELLSAVEHLLDGALPNAPPGPSRDPTYLSLLDFPGGFSPLTVIVGDKREEEPKNAGDLFAFTASSVDDRWLARLRLPNGTEKLSDKVVMTASEDRLWLQEHLGNKHILCVGSPASNLFAREYNHCFLFRFAISTEAARKWKSKREEMLSKRTPAELLAFKEGSKQHLKQTMRLFKQPGFVDFNYAQLKLGIDPVENRDFAVVSIGRNPFAKDPKFFSILAAGVHHPGTAHAVAFLADPNNFVGRPFGGVLEVQVPSDEFSREDVPWHAMVEKSKAQWHSVGDQSLEYTPKQLLENLRHWKNDISAKRVITDVYFHEEAAELAAHEALVDSLKEARSAVAPRAAD